MNPKIYSPDKYNSSQVQKIQQKHPNVSPDPHSQQNQNLPRSNLHSHPKKIGNYKYHLNDQIGRGYSSIVYKGRQIHTQQEVAVKVIDLKENNHNAKMQEDEIKILRTLDHPNIIKCHDVYKTQSHYYIVSEYCNQGDLYRFIGRHKRIQQVAAISIMTQIIEGVKYLMANNIIHRDLKPANILKTETGWKIADFGFAITSSKHMKSKYNVGTPLYMPLEALLDNVYSPKSDIFSVGIILYQLLTGTTPWQCRQQKELIKKLKNVPYAFPETVEVSKGIKSILSRLCAVIYQQRMDKQDFMQLNLTYISVNPEEKILSCNSYRIGEERQEKGEKLNRNKSAQNMSTNQISEHSIDSKTETRNNHILVNQLHYCRFIYYYIKNVKYLRVSPKNQIKLTLVMFKHLEKLVLLLADRHANAFKLDRWEAFRETQKFYSTNATMKQYSSRYSKEYMNYLKDVETETVQLINRNFHHLTLHETFTRNCYSQILKYISTLLREANHNLTLESKDAEQPVSAELRAGIEALRHLLNYHKLVKMSSLNFQDFEYFEKESHIRVQIDFSSSKATLEVYAAIREELKFI